MADTVLLSLCGDVMLGRGIDQVLPHPGDPELREPAAGSARTYVELAERMHGPIPKPVAFVYPWGDALAVLEEADLRIVNLETSITAGGAFVPKGINYRMHPANVGVLTAARIDCCTLANNHVLDFGIRGLDDTLAALRGARVAFAGAGEDASTAAAPAWVDLPGGGRVAVFSCCSATSGVPYDWAAAEQRPGVWLLPDLSVRTMERVAAQVARFKRAGDVAIVSIHWGENWGFRIPGDQRRFAYGLVESGTVDVVHGHSAHHVKRFEVHRRKLILYGCGDFINDYEGIAGREGYRPDLALAFMAAVDVETGALRRLAVVPFVRARFRLCHAGRDAERWLRALLGRGGMRGLRLLPPGDAVLAFEPV